MAAAGSAADGVTIVRVDPATGPDPAETAAAPAADPASLPPADARDAGRAVRAAEDLPTAAAVVAALDRFAAARRLDDRAAEILEGAREEFRPRAAAGEVRSGRDWVAPAERDARRRAAADAVAGGLAGLETGNLSAARELFEEASDADPDGILGDLWLGAGYTLGGALWDASRARGQAIAGAKDHFEEVLRRRPDHVGALNNLALAEWKLNDVRAAVRAWTEAAEIAPASRQLVQNVGRANRLAGSGVVPVGRRESRELAELYMTLSAAATGATFDDGTGWLVMPPVDPRAVESPGPEPPPAETARRRPGRRGDGGERHRVLRRPRLRADQPARRRPRGGARRGRRPAAAVRPPRRGRGRRGGTRPRSWWPSPPTGTSPCCGATGWTPRRSRWPPARPGWPPTSWPWVTRGRACWAAG